MPYNDYDQSLKNAKKEDTMFRPGSETDSKPEYIWVASSADTIDKPEHIPTTIMEQSAHFIFTERVWAPNAFLKWTQVNRNRTGTKHYVYDFDATSKQTDGNPKINGYPTKKVEEHLIGVPYDSLMLVNMGPYGYGLVTRVHIKRLELLFNYTGALLSLEVAKDTESAYRLLVKDGLLGTYYHSDYKYSVAKGVIDAQLYRNFSAFALHAPFYHDLSLRDNLSSLFVFESKELLDSVGIANMTGLSKPVYIDGLPTHQFHAGFEMPPDTMIFLNYGEGYWQTQGKQPELFTRGGRVIPHDGYYPSRLYIKNPNSKEFDITRVFTSDVFSALLHKKAWTTYSYQALKQAIIEHLGNVRFASHYKCFLSLNPEEVLCYRKDKFIKRVESGKDVLENFKPRMQHFGFTFFENNEMRIDTDHSTPKLPLKGI